MDLTKLTTELVSAFDAETSADPDGWTPENPTFGHCAVASLIIQDHFGGDLLRTTVDGVSHYYNRLPDGAEVDVTRAQFPVWAPGDVATRDRDYVLSFPATAQRYQLLRDRLHQGT